MRNSKRVPNHHEKEKLALTWIPLKLHQFYTEANGHIMIIYLYTFHIHYFYKQIITKNQKQID